MNPPNPYPHFVSEFVRLLRDGQNYPLGGFAPCPRPALAPDAPKAMIFSPHPDDEAIIGGLALRLMREAKWRVLNVAVTHGSKPERKAARVAELQGCCDCLGFEIIHAAPHGLDEVYPKCRAAQAPHWAPAVEAIARILAEHLPRVLLLPHELDGHPTHIGTHYLVMDALKQLPSSYSPYLVETEVWGQLPTPNLMVEISPSELADLITALTFHVGEVRRNPYHLTFPAWAIDNVRRGSELVGGHGAAAQAFQFATLYRLRRWREGRVEDVLAKGRSLSSEESAATLFTAA